MASTYGPPFPKPRPGRSGLCVGGSVIPAIHPLTIGPQFAKPGEAGDDVLAAVGAPFCQGADGTLPLSASVLISPITAMLPQRNPRHRPPSLASGRGGGFLGIGAVMAIKLDSLLSGNAILP
jgi:hypothetical protein